MRSTRKSCVRLAQPELTQHRLAQELGVSLGKAHHCIKVRIDKDLIKMGNFSHSQKKLEYVYLLTPSGMKSKAKLTAHFLARKSVECSMLKRELEKYDKHAKHSKHVERSEVMSKEGEGR